jgi:hypothetical protein
MYDLLQEMMHRNSILFINRNISKKLGKILILLRERNSSMLHILMSLFYFTLPHTEVKETKQFYFKFHDVYYMHTISCGYGPKS